MLQSAGRGVRSFRRCAPAPRGRGPPGSERSERKGGPRREQTHDGHTPGTSAGRVQRAPTPGGNPATAGGAAAPGGRFQTAPRDSKNAGPQQTKTTAAPPTDRPHPKQRSATPARTTARRRQWQNSRSDPPPTPKARSDETGVRAGTPRAGEGDEERPPEKYRLLAQRGSTLRRTLVSAKRPTPAGRSPHLSGPRD